MLSMRRRRWMAGLVAIGLFATACSGGSSDGGGETDSGTGSGDTSSEGGGEAAPTGGSFSMYSAEPSFLAPTSNCYVTVCGQVIGAVFTGLLTIDPETSEQVLGVAASIASPDSKVWTVKLKEGWKFHNGEPVDADSFVRAWNYAAYGPNATETGFFLSAIDGYDDLQGNKPKAKEMSGLKAVDDSIIEITLSESFSQWPFLMSFTPAFAPMAQECLDDLKACNEEPIGNGPYQMAEPWKHNQSITLAKYEEYQGDNAGNADEIELQISENLSTSFREWQAGNLDITVPDPTQIPQAQALAGDRFVQSDNGVFQYIGMPLYVKEFQDPKIRQALSLAIDRDTIVDKVFQGAYTPAQDVISPFVPGARTDACDLCRYDPEEAKRLYDEAGGIPGDTVTISFNNDGGHEQWIQAVANGWRNDLGLDYKLKAQPSAPYFEAISNESQTGPYRSGWAPDYPSPENYLDPLYGSGEAAGTGWSGPAHDEFLELIDEGGAAPTPEEGISAYQAAADVVLEELPVIPLWMGLQSYVYSENVDNVTYDPLQQFVLTDVTVN